MVSWINYSKTNPQDQEIEQAQFKRDLLGVLTHINGLMLKTEREFIGAQTVALKNFMSIFTDLEKIYNITERSKIAINFINSVNYDESRKLLNLEKLQLILNLVESDLFLHDGTSFSHLFCSLSNSFTEVRGIMMPTLAKHLKQHLNGASADDVLKCGKILQMIIESIQIRLKDVNSPPPLAPDGKPITFSQIAELANILPEIMSCIKGTGITKRVIFAGSYYCWCSFRSPSLSRFDTCNVFCILPYGARTL